MDNDKIIVHVDKDLEAIVPNFLRNKRKDIETMLQALKDKEFHEIEVLGHRIKGAGGGYGFDEISRIGASIEEAASQENIPIIQNSLEELRAYLSCVEVIYEEDL